MLELDSVAAMDVMGDHAELKRRRLQAALVGQRAAPAERSIDQGVNSLMQ